MCGFAGILTRTPQDPSHLSEAVDAMSGRMVHRGPDDADTWVEPQHRVALAFRRLAILDLSPLGRQPMASASGRFVMTFNGEVYNFRALRTELAAQGATFRGDSDSEVILAAVEAWGIEAALQRFVGMFALALWDARERALHLVRDRVGIKPLYLAVTRRGMAFASELGALLALEDLDRTLDPAGLDQYLRYLCIPAPRTPFRQVRKLLPGHHLVLRPDALPGADEAPPSGTPWWSVADVRAEGAAEPWDPQAPDASVVDALEAHLRDAVALRMIADVPLGALLSGGVDSSVVVALMQERSSQPVRTFTIGFDDPTHDESADARAVAAHLGTRHTELPVTGADALAVVPELPRLFDEPLADPSQIPTWLVSSLARRDVTVALTGDGGDELFAGYTRHAAGGTLIPRAQRLPPLPRRLVGRAMRGVRESTWDRAARFAPGANGVRLAGQKAHKLGRILEAPSEAEAYATLLSSEARRLRSGQWGGGDISQDPVRSLLASLTEGREGHLTLSDMLEVDQRYYLPDDLLQKVDRASMAVSLEARVPLLDHRVVAFAWRLQDRHRIRDGRGKWVLREVLYRHLPRSLVDRPKTGFSVPLARWLRGPLREWSEALLLAPDAGRLRLFDGPALARGWADFQERRSEGALDWWTLLMLEAWRAEWGVEVHF